MIPWARGFTLIELMVSSALAILLAMVATSAFLQIRRAVARSEARLAMHADAERIYASLHRRLGSLQQTGALVYASTAQSSSRGGSVSLVFLRAKEHPIDWGFEHVGYGELGTGARYDPAADHVLFQRWVANDYRGFRPRTR